MPRDRNDNALLHDMMQAAQAVVRYLANKTRDELDRNEVLRDAVERRLEIIGEAARRVSPVMQDSHPEIPWRKIMATRHILAHDYDDVNIDIVWRIATVYVPELIELLKPLIPVPPADPELLP